MIYACARMPYETLSRYARLELVGIARKGVILDGSPASKTTPGEAAGMNRDVRRALSQISPPHPRWLRRLSG